MNRFVRGSLVIVAGAGLSLTASPALAHDDTPESSGPWVPIEELRPDFYDAAVEVEACGTTVTITSGDVRERVGRQTTRGDGSTLFKMRGDYTIDLTRADTGETIDELDVSGPYHEIISADASEYDAWYHGPSILYPYPALGPVDAAAFEAAGIPDLAYFEHGVVYFDLVIDTETGLAVSETADVRAPRLVDLCDWFGDGDRGDHQERNTDTRHNWKD
ncbi:MULTISPECIES: hypothetical protein [unclassified Geodermatophilus]